MAEGMIWGWLIARDGRVAEVIEMGKEPVPPIKAQSKVRSKTGRKNGHLSAAKARTIRRRATRTRAKVWEFCRSEGMRYHVTPQTVRNVVTGKTWKHASKEK